MSRQAKRTEPRAKKKSKEAGALKHNAQTVKDAILIKENLPGLPLAHQEAEPLARRCVSVGGRLT